MRSFNFERLEVWQRARRLVRVIYDVTKGFPADERYGLTAHIRKTAISLISNIAEGASRRSSADKVRFIEIAIGSLYELLAQFCVAFDQEYTTEKEFEKLYAQCDEIARMLNGLARVFLTSKL